MKFGMLITSIKFYKMCNFENKMCSFENFENFAHIVNDIIVFGMSYTILCKIWFR